MKLGSNGKKYFDYELLEHVARKVTRNLNKVIDRNYYPIPESERSNMRHRPIGVGVQGFADLLIAMKFPYESEEATKLNLNVFETIYWGCVSESVELAKIQGPYETFQGSPASKGLLQFDLWNYKPTSGRYNWDKLKEEVKKYGLRNSLLTTIPPTASTSQLLGFCEEVAPYSSNIQTRRVLAGDFTVVNESLINDLDDLGLWDKDMKDEIIRNKGSVQNIDRIPQSIKDLYKTSWEIKQMTLADLSRDRGYFQDQSQSFSINIAEPTIEQLTSMHFYTWKIGLKTGMYYLRTRPAADAAQFTIDLRNPTQKENLNTKTEDIQVCKKEEGCIVCSS